LGDSGSLTIGFLLGCFGIIWSQKSATFLGMLAPAMALSLPLFDAGLSIGRRFLRNQPIFQADRGHIHHRLLGFGLHPRLVAVILYAVCGIAATLSLLQSSLSNHLGGLIILLFCSLAFFAIKRPGYVEFITAGRVLRGGGVLRLVRHEIYLHNSEDSLLRATTPSECWAAIRRACLDLNFASAYLVLEGEIFQEIFDSFAAESAWQFSKSLGRKGRMTLTRMIKKDSPSLMSSFFHILQASMESKICLDKAEQKSVGMSA
jgi:UDP-GlcNAc:undecaprenyl-phosphate/decaprenyl-phosphate GlcNAc-1-phosphate transferase